MAASRRTGVVFTFGQEVSFEDLEQLPKGRIGRGTQLADVAHIGATETTIITVTGVVVGADREISVKAKVTATVDVNDTRNTLELILYQASTVIGVSHNRLPPDAGDLETCIVEGIADTSSGTFTFTLKGVRANGTQLLTVNANSTDYGLMTITDEGPTF